MNFKINPDGETPLDLFGLNEIEARFAEGVFNEVIHKTILSCVNRAAEHVGGHIDTQLAERAVNRANDKGLKGLVLEINAPVDIEKECIINFVETVKTTGAPEHLAFYMTYSLGRFRQAINNDYQALLNAAVNEIVREKTGGTVGVGVATATSEMEMLELRERLCANGQREVVTIEELKPTGTQCKPCPLPTIEDLGGCKDPELESDDPNAAPRMQVSWTHGEA